MKIDENKYNELFIDKFKAHSSELFSEFNRVISEYGDTEEIRTKFYTQLFESLILQFKSNLPKDDRYEWIITTLYNHFIEAIEADEIDSSKYRRQLKYFKEAESIALLKSAAIDTEKIQPVYKNYNPNTKYGRRKAREQAALNYQNGTPEYRKEIDNIGVIVFVILFIIAVIVFFIKASAK